MIPKITIIAQILSTQSAYITNSVGQMFYYIDKSQLWYDNQTNNRVQLTDVIILQFERERTNFAPSRLTDYPGEFGQLSTSTRLANYNLVYVIETNCLYKYENTAWTILYGKYGVLSVANTYLPNGTIQTIYADDVTTNGILNDGSVVIRDSNKMICGLLQSDGYTVNVLSLIGGCLNLEPSGVPYGKGCLQLNTNLINDGSVSQQNDANLNANLNVFGNVYKIPEQDWNKQYRLVTEDLLINSSSTVVKGSTIVAGSTLGDVNYNVDTILTENVTVTQGLILKNSKLYKDCIINQGTLNAPYLFDLDNITDKQSFISQTTVDSSLTDISILDNNILFINRTSPLKNVGDTCFINYSKTQLSMDNITKVKFTDNEYNIVYKAQEGIQKYLRIVLYFQNEVKVMP